MTKQKMGLLVVVLLVALGLAACAEEEAAPESVQAAEDYFSKLEDQDEAGVKDYLCENRHQNLNFAGPVGQDVDYDFDLKYRLGGDQDEGSGVVYVTVYGTIEVSLEREYIEVKREEKRAEAVAWQVKVAEFDGGWLVCGGNVDYLLDVDAATEVLFNLDELLEVERAVDDASAPVDAGGDAGDAADGRDIG